MTEKISENRQLYRTLDSDDEVAKVKHILKDRFHSAAAMQVMELEVSQKYMATEPYGLMLNQQHTPPTTEQEHQHRHMPVLPVPTRVNTNVLANEDKTHYCGRWQEYKYPCRHAMAYFRKWEEIMFPDILQMLMHDYYKNKSMPFLVVAIRVNC